MRRRPQPSDQAPESALARLLEVESRLETMLEQVRAEAEGMVRDAEEKGTARDMGLAAELAVAERTLSAQLAVESEAHIAKERSRLSAVRAKYEKLDERQVDILAAWVVEEVLRTAAGEDP